MGFDLFLNSDNFNMLRDTLVCFCKFNSLPLLKTLCNGRIFQWLNPFSIIKFSFTFYSKLHKISYPNCWDLSSKNQNSELNRLTILYSGNCNST